jgi:hypothetical protein
MLKAVAGDMLILGLSKLNVERLQEGKPILFDATDFGFPGKSISIIYGVTEEAIKDDLDSMVRRPN